MSLTAKQAFKETLDARKQTIVTYRKYLDMVFERIGNSVREGKTCVTTTFSDNLYDDAQFDTLKSVSTYLESLGYSVSLQLLNLTINFQEQSYYKLIVDWSNDK